MGFQVKSFQCSHNFAPDSCVVIVTTQESAQGCVSTRTTLKQAAKVHRNSSRMPRHNRAPLFKSTRPLDHINKQIKSLLQLHHFYFENMTNNCMQQRYCLMRESLYMHKVPPAWWVISFTSNDTCRIHSAQNLMKPFFQGTAFL